MFLGPRPKHEVVYPRADAKWRSMGTSLQPTNHPIGPSFARLSPVPFPSAPRASANCGNGTAVRTMPDLCSVGSAPPPAGRRMAESWMVG